MPNLLTAADSLPFPAKTSTNKSEDALVKLIVVPATKGGAFTLGQGRPPPAPAHAPLQALEERAPPLPAFPGLRSLLLFFFQGSSAVALSFFLGQSKALWSMDPQIRHPV